MSIVSPEEGNAIAIVVEQKTLLERVSAGLDKLATFRMKELVHETYEAQEDLQCIRNLEISDQASLDCTQGVTADLKAKKKRLEAGKKEVTGPINELLDKIHDLYRPLLSSLDQSEGILKKKMAEALRRLQEEQTLALQAVSKAVREGAMSEAKVAMDGMPGADLPEGMSVREIWKFKVVDASLVPNEFLMVVVNDSAIEAAVANGIREIPGVDIFKQDSVTIRQPRGTKA